jgi:ketosteroid isomerase-like protein
MTAPSHRALRNDRLELDPSDVHQVSWQIHAESGVSIVTDEPSVTTVSAADIEEIRALFLRQAEAENAHDIEAIDAVLARTLPGQPDPVNFVARAYCFWGREAVLGHFRTIFAGTWRFEPDQSAIRILPLGADVAHIFAPTRVTLDAGGGQPATYAFLINEFAIRTQEGWRISAIVPVPAP